MQPNPVYEVKQKRRRGMYMVQAIKIDGIKLKWIRDVVIRLQYEARHTIN